MEERVMKNIPQEERFDKDKFTGKDVQLETYDRLPVNDFGIKMLQAMGWTESRGIGKKQHVQQVLVAAPRNNRIGLGSDLIPKNLDKKALEKQKRESIKDVTGSKLNQKETNKFNIYKGTEIKIQTGKHKDLEGVVLNLDLDTQICSVELKNGAVVKVSVYDLEDINVIKDRQKLEQKSKKIKKNKKKSRSRSNSCSSDSSYTGSDSDSRSSSSSEKKKSKKSKKKEKKQKKDKKSKKEKKSKKDKKNKKEKNEKKGKVLKWIMPNIKIKVISKEFNELYNLKLRVQDVLDEYSFSCLAPNGSYIDNLKEKDVQTVMPSIEGNVLILKGEFKGKRGILKSRDKKNNSVMIQLLEGDLGFFQCTQDDVSEI